MQEGKSIGITKVQDDSGLNILDKIFFNTVVLLLERALDVGNVDML